MPLFTPCYQWNKVSGFMLTLKIYGPHPEQTFWGLQSLVIQAACGFGHDSTHAEIYIKGKRVLTARLKVSAITSQNNKFPGKEENPLWWRVGKRQGDGT